MDDYERIADVIRRAQTRGCGQAKLAEMARWAGLDAFRLHRLFTRWVGITPKAFLATMTLEHARALLRRGESVLSASLEAGLSGPGRLHDLAVHLEAASPGEIKSGGDGWSLQAGLAESPFGPCFIASGPRGICHVSFPGDARAGMEMLEAEWPRAKLERRDEIAAGVARRLFTVPASEGKISVEAAPNDARSQAPGRPLLRAFVRGTAFQVKVWRALLRIPGGAAVSYGALAAAVGHPKATRAVGTAVGANPIAWLIPCHRVIRESGSFGNYAFGPERKRAMLTWESAKYGPP